MLVSMRWSAQYDVPQELALLYDFANTLDCRRYIEQGTAHTGGDELATPQQMDAWMRKHHLLQPGGHVDPADHRRALVLRDALRAFLESPPADRRQDAAAARLLTSASTEFPLTLSIGRDGAVALQPAPGSSALGRVLAEIFALAVTDRLARLKACASEDCRWVFFDRSKPANRHWCSSSLCGNRQKTRTYRHRHREQSQRDRGRS